jgi:hypothetical protein
MADADMLGINFGFVSQGAAVARSINFHRLLLYNA